MKPNWKTLFLLTTCCTLGLITTAKAQVSPDGTLSTTVTSPNNLNFTINNGDRVGGNLFHSFREFSVPNGGSAVFQNALDVRNIISRVTGGSLSQINGLIQAQGTANLFLLNPAGISFGQNARLSIGGSFFATTADSLLFGDGIEFSATNPQAPLLTVNIPIGLRFRDNSGSITNTSSNFGLEVPSGQTLALIGGDVGLDGGVLIAQGGKVELGGLKAAGTVGINNDRSLSFPDGVTRGDISFSNGALVDVRFIGGGSIAVNGRNVEISGGSGLVAGIFPGFGMSEAQAGDIVINATDKVTITGTANSGSLIANLVGSNAAGNAGKVIINTGSLEGSGNFTIGSFTFGRGNAGTVSITAKDKVSLEGLQGFGSGIVSLVGSSARGNASDVDISAGSVVLDNARLLTSNAGRGNAGNITVQAKDTISVKGSLILSNVGSPQGVPANGNVGNILLDARVVSLTDGSELQAGFYANAQGNPGNVSIRARESVSFTGSRIFANVDPGGLGNGSNVEISAGSVFLDNARLETSNAGQGNAGNITVQAKDTISLAKRSNILSNVGNVQGVAARGNVGNILLDARVVSLTDTSQLQAGFFANAQGNPGTVSIRARESVSFTGQNSGIFANVDPGGLGDSSDVEISAESFSLKDRAVLITGNAGRGNGGDIAINVGSLALSNFSQIRSGVEPGGEGIGGDIDIRGRSLTLTGGSQIGTFVFRELNGLSGGKGRAGNIDINATDFVNIFGVGTAGFSSGLFASAERGTTAISPQAAGNINLTTGDFRIGDGAVVDALTSNSGNAGNITINANTFTANGGGQLITTTFNSGSAGNINLNIRDRITISGSDPNYNQRIQGTFDNQGAASGIFANTASGSTGNGGNITIQQEQNRFPTIAIADGGQVTVASQGQGQGGEISITGNSLTLDRGIINASTQSGDGGNINLRLRNFIRLRNESLISANARGQQGGNGGNITINTPFIVAFPRNNDIIANAVSGSGGRVTTNATLFGIIPRTRADLERLGVPGLNPRNLSTSDITAFSERNSNFGDNLQLTSPDVDPSRGLVELPETVTDTTQKIAESPCRQGFGNEFAVTGRGGLPTTPNQPLNSDNVRVDLLQPVASSGNSRATIKPATTITARRVPAQGWIFNDKGQVVLTAYDPTNTDSQRPFSTAAACPAR